MSELLAVCPRCGNPHDIGVQDFKKKMVIPNVNKKYQQSASKWAMCPVTGEPILFWDVPDRWVKLSRPLPVPKRQVESLAHFLWEFEGKPEGRADLHWAYAEAALSEYFWICAEAEDRDEMANEFNDSLSKMAEAAAKEMDRKIIGGYYPEEF